MHLDPVGELLSCVSSQATELHARFSHAGLTADQHRSLNARHGDCLT
jgi:hypothetical protein